VIGKYRKANEVLFRMWERHGQPKIALKIQNEEHMVRLAATSSIWCVSPVTACCDRDCQHTS
jgi:peptidyl-tRNA hydrolase